MKRKVIDRMLFLGFSLLSTSCSIELVYQEKEEEKTIIFDEKTLTLMYTQEMPGTLSDFVEKHFLKKRLKSLKVVGPINGTDLRCIREMAGSDLYGQKTSGSLKSLDLAQCEFVEGGNAYFIERIADGSSTKEYYTKPNCIPYSAFRNCQQLSNMILPEDIESIEQCAFEGCSMLYKINLPNSLRTIGKRAFYLCSILKYDFQGGFVTIPDGITEISDSVFAGCKILNVKLPNTIRKIGNSAFSSCRDLVIEWYPDYLQDIGEYAFSDCTQIESMLLPNSIKKIPKGLFKGCSKLSYMKFHDSIRSIGDSAFYHCSNLKQIELNDGLQYIGDETFSYTSLTGVLDLPSTLKEIGNNAFSKTNVNSVIVNSDIQVHPSEGYAFYGGTFSECNSLQNVIVREGVCSFELRFNSCKVLNKLILPSSLRRIGTKTEDERYGYNFKRCLSLTHIDLPVGLDSIGLMCFSGSGLESIIFPDSLSFIGKNAFTACDNLTNVILPFTLKKLEFGAFSSCANLTKIIINSQITEISPAVFYGCKKLNEVIIPATTIGNIRSRAFDGCVGLSHMIIPNTVSSIENLAFRGCVNLKQIENLSLTPQIITKAVFENVPIASATLIVPLGSLALYKHAEGWKEFGEVSERK